MKRKHKHLRVRAYVNNPLYDQSQIENWIRSLCLNGIDMNIMSGPHYYYAQSEINKGWTATAIIEFSHISLHIWENEGLVEFDVFSCKDFDTRKVMEFIKQFKPIRIFYDDVDRETDFIEWTE
jgi:S-adenosylmethionine/arginine decarboxylase-like enzyme